MPNSSLDCSVVLSELLLSLLSRDLDVMMDEFLVGNNSSMFITVAFVSVSCCSSCCSVSRASIALACVDEMLELPCINNL